MITATIDHKNRYLLMVYPEAFKRKEELVKIESNQQALNVWKMRVRHVIMDTLMKYKNQRTHALCNYMTVERQVSIREINENLLKYYEGYPFSVFLRQMMRLCAHIKALAPREGSRHREHYETVICPTFHWISAYLKSSGNI